MPQAGPEDEVVIGTTLSADHHRLARRAHWFALLCPIFAGAATIGASIAIHDTMQILGLPLSNSPGGYFWIRNWIVLPLNGLAGTVGAIYVVCRLHPVPDDHFGAGVTWLFCAPVVYVATMMVMVIGLLSLGVQ